MTTPETTFARTPQVQEHFVFPDPPEDPEDKMTSFDHLTITGSAHYLAIHLGNRETTLVAGDRYVSPIVTGDMAGLRYPDLLVAFGVDPEAYRRSNAYVVSEQGKAPDFVLEVASKSTGRVDVTEKRVEYARLGIGEYWRFDETGKYHGAELAGDRLVEGRYEPIALETLADGVLQGYSAVLNLHLRWEGGALAFHDPATGRPIASLEGERDARAAAETRADTEQARAEVEREGRSAAEARAEAAEARAEVEREGRSAAEARVRELEERLRGHGG